MKAIKIFKLLLSEDDSLHYLGLKMISSLSEEERFILKVFYYDNTFVELDIPTLYSFTYTTLKYGFRDVVGFTITKELQLLINELHLINDTIHSIGMGKY